MANLFRKLGGTLNKKFNQATSLAVDTATKLLGSTVSSKTNKITQVARTVINLGNGIVSGNGYDGRALKRMELEYSDISWKFAINPDEITVRQPNYATLTPTKNGIWIDEWGKGVKEINITGTTGVRGSGLGGTIDVGYQKFVELKQLFDKWFEDTKEGADLSSTEKLIKFYNYTDCFYYYVIPMNSGLQLSRSKTRPHIYQYTISLWVIKDMTDKPSANILENLLGNPFKDLVGSIESITKTGELINSATKLLKTPFGSTSREVELLNDDNSSTSTIVNPEVDVIVKQSQKSKSWKLVLEDSKRCYTRLAPFIGMDFDCKVTPAVAYGIIKTLKFTNNGICQNTFSTDNLEPEENDTTYDFFVKPLHFENRVSNTAMVVFNMLKGYDSQIISRNYDMINYATGGTTIQYTAHQSKKYNSTIFKYMKEYIKRFEISKDYYNKLCLILLDTMALYVDLYYLVNNDNKMEITFNSTELNRLITNVEYLYTYFEKQDTEQKRINLISLVRELKYLVEVLYMVRIDIMQYF